MSAAARVVLEADADGRIKVDARGVPSDQLERILLAVLAGLQRELLARRVVALQREGIVVAARIPGDGGGRG